MLWSRAVCADLSDFFCGPGNVAHNQPIFFVTLVHINRARPLTDSNLDIKAIKQRLRYGLRGQPYYGIIEPAYYTNLQAGVRFAEKRCVFWHLHALVWNVSARKLKKHLRLLQQ